MTEYPKVIENGIEYLVVENGPSRKQFQPFEDDDLTCIVRLIEDGEWKSYYWINCKPIQSREIFERQLKLRSFE